MTEEEYAAAASAEAEVAAKEDTAAAKEDTTAAAAEEGTEPAPKKYKTKAEMTPAERRARNALRGGRNLAEWNKKCTNRVLCIAFVA
jgi:hypothetical protein